MKRKNIIIIVILLMCFIGLALTMFIIDSNKEDDETSTENSTQIESSEVYESNGYTEGESDEHPSDDQTQGDDWSTEDNQPSNDTIHGLPLDIFDHTAGREFEFVLKNTHTGDTFPITLTTTFKDITFDFWEPPTNDAEPAPDMIIEKGKTQLHVETNESPFNVLLIGSTNETNQKYIPFEDGRIIYVSYRGDDEWSICGVDTSMTKEEVIDLWGTPTQAYQLDDGYSMEWYILVDEHTYFLNAIFNPRNNQLLKVVLNIDNYPVFGQ